MVDFVGIRIAGDYILANVRVSSTEGEFKIKLHKTKEEYEILPDKYPMEIVKALWRIQRELKEKGKLPKNTSVAWY